MPQVRTRNTAIDRAINLIDEAAWTPVRYPGAVRDPDTGDWISDAEVAEIGYTTFASTKVRFTARLLVRRVKDARFRDALFPVWRYHPFFTNTDLPVAEADITPPPTRDHRNRLRRPDRRTAGPHALRKVRANSAWVWCTAIAHNLLRAAGVLAGGAHAVARGATLRRKIVNIPARLARPQRRPILHTYPVTGPGPITAGIVAHLHWLQPHQPPRPSDHPHRTGPTGDHR